MKLLVFDTETTGLIKTYIHPDTLNELPTIVQFSYIIYDTITNKMNVSKNYIIKVLKGVIIPEESIIFHKITNQISENQGIMLNEVLNEYLCETKRRKEKFRELLFDVNKLTKFDKDIKEIYEIIEPIIDTYCGQFITFCDLDQETYDRIFRVLGTIRTNKNNIEILRLLITKN